MKKKVKKMKRINLIGQRFGRLEVIGLVPKDKRPTKTAHRGNHWYCKCDCGNVVIHYTGALNQGDIKSCGCLSQETKKAKGFNEIGNKYGKLTVVAKAPDEYNSIKPHWVCECECGGIAIVCGASLRNGHTKSCGCLRAPASIEVGQRFGKLTVLTQGSSTPTRQKQWWCQCDCGEKRLIPASNLLTGNSTSCGCDKGSKGEKIIKQYLTNNNIKFITQYSFPKLRLKLPLRFDFALLNKDNDIICLIEYQGIQHYKNIEYFNSEHTQLTDKMKKEYCSLHNIPLHEIRYDKDTIEQLKDIINNYEGAF